MNQKAIFSAIGEILKTELSERDARIDQLGNSQLETIQSAVVKYVSTQEFVDQLKGDPGKDAIVDYDTLVETVKANESLLDRLRGDKGDTPELNVDDIVKQLVPHIPKPLEPKNGLNGIGIKAVEQEDASSFALVLDNDQTIEVALPKTEKGEQGDQGAAGAKGIDGLDRPVLDVRKACAGLDRNEVVYHNGGLYQATKKTVGTPADDAGAYRLLLNGIDKAEFGADVIERKYDLTLRKTDGEQQKLSIDFNAGYVHDPKTVTRLFAGDFTLEGTKLKVFDGDEWDELQLRGRVGREGKRGVGVKDVSLTKEYLRLTMTDGKNYDLPIVEKVMELLATEFKELLVDFSMPVAEDVDEPIKRYAGIHNQNDTYNAGDVVTTYQGLYLALKRTREPVSNKNDWAFMLGVQTSGGAGGGGGKPVTTSTIVADGPMDMDSYRIENLGDPRAWPDPDGKGDAVSRDWVLKNSNNIKTVAKVGDLPSTNDINNPIYPGAAYLIKETFQGEELNRFAIYDPSLLSVGGIGSITAQIDPADHAVIIANAGQSYGGEIYVGGNGDARFTVNYMNNGELQIIVDQPGTGYEIGERYQHNGLANLQAVIFTVETLSNANRHGGWRFVDTHNFIKDLVVDKTQNTDQNEGDFLSTVEIDKKQLKVFHNGSWIDLFDEVKIKSWIASLSLFEGTAQEIGGSNVSALELTGLPDLAALTASGDLSKTSHYFTWVGSPNYVVQAGDPNIGGDLAGAILNPGDWLQVANQGGDGTGVGANGGPINLKWVNVGGDLLAKSRGDHLFGLNTFTPGSWEKGSVVSYNNALYKAKDGVIGTDIAPGDQSGQKGVWSLTVPVDVTTGTNIDITLTDVLAGVTHVVSHTVAAGETAQQTATALTQAINALPATSALVTAVDSALWPGVVDVKGNNDGFAFTLSSSTTSVATAEVNPAVMPAANKWEKIDLAAGIQWVPSDGDLPAAGANDGELYFVLQSAMAGGAGEVYYWDSSVNKWLPSGGDTKSEDSIPIGSIMAFATTTPPNGWLKLDGSKFDRAIYTQLGNLLNSDTLPDFRGKFLRSKSDTDLILSLHDFTTGKPKVDFKAADAGQHHHGLKTKNLTYDTSGVVGHPPNGYAGGGYAISNDSVQPGGHHTHQITGGDAETAPDHAIVEYFIKAKNATTLIARDKFQALATNLQQGDIWVYDSISQTFKNTQISDLLGINDWDAANSYQQGTVVWFDNCLFSCKTSQLVNGATPQFATDTPEWGYIGQCFRLANDTLKVGAVPTYTGTGYEMKVPMQTAIDTQPAQPAPGDLWLDRVTKLGGDFGLKVYDGANWLLANVANDKTIKGNSLAIPAYLNKKPDDAELSDDDINVAFKYNNDEMQLFADRKDGANRWEQITPLLGDPANSGKPIVADANGLPAWGDFKQQNATVTDSAANTKIFKVVFPRKPVEHISIEIMAKIAGPNGSGNVVFRLLDGAGAGMDMTNIFTGSINGGSFHNNVADKSVDFLNYDTEPKMQRNNGGFRLYPNEGYYDPGAPALTKINFRMFRNPNSTNSGWLGNWTIQGPMWGNMGQGYVSFYSDTPLFSNSKGIQLTAAGSSTFEFVIARVEFN